MKIDTNLDQFIFLRQAASKEVPAQEPTNKYSERFAQGQVLEITLEQRLGSSENTPLPSTNYSSGSNNKVTQFSLMADSNGQIQYNGVVYQYDGEKRSLSLGDMSNKKDVLTINLSDGVSFYVNRNNFDDLAKSIGMFSAKDQGIIMRALSTDAKARSINNEVEQELGKVCDLGQ